MPVRLLGHRHVNFAFFCSSPNHLTEDAPTDEANPPIQPEQRSFANEVSEENFIAGNSIGDAFLAAEDGRPLHSISRIGDELRQGRLTKANSVVVQRKLGTSQH